MSEPGRGASGVSGSVLPMRPTPGQTPPEAYAAALERLVDSMLMVCTIRRQTADAFRLALRIAVTAAPFGAQGSATEKLLTSLLKKLDAHVASVPDTGKPTDAA